MFDFVNGWYIRLMIMGSIKNSLYGGRSLGYQDFGNRSYNFYIGNYDSNDYRSNKTIQKNVG